MCVHKTFLKKRGNPSKILPKLATVFMQMKDYWGGKGLEALRILTKSHRNSTVTATERIFDLSKYFKIKFI